MKLSWTNVIQGGVFLCCISIAVTWNMMKSDIRQLEHDVMSYEQANILSLSDALAQFNKMTSHFEEQVNTFSSVEQLTSEVEKKQKEVSSLTNKMTQIALELENMKLMLKSRRALVEKLYPEKKSLRIYKNNSKKINEYKLVLNLLAIKPGESAELKVNKKLLNLKLGEVESLVVHQNKSCYIEMLDPDHDLGKAYADIQLRCAST